VGVVVCPGADSERDSEVKKIVIFWGCWPGWDLVRDRFARIDSPGRAEEENEKSPGG